MNDFSYYYFYKVDILLKYSPNFCIPCQLFISTKILYSLFIFPHFFIFLLTLSSLLSFAKISRDYEKPWHSFFSIYFTELFCFRGGIFGWPIAQSCIVKH